MSHLIILTLVLNLMAGTAVFLYTLAAARRYHRPVLRTLLAYILSFNGLVVIYLGYQYTLINVFRGDMTRLVEYPALFMTLFLLVFCAELGMTVNLFRLVRRLKGRTMPGLAKGLFGLWGAGFGAAFTWSLLRFFQNHKIEAFDRIHAAWMFSVIVIILSSVGSGLVGTGAGGEDPRSRRSFAWIFLAAYAAFGFSSLDFYVLRTGIEKYYDPVILLLINLCPLIWLRLFYEKELVATGVRDVDEGRLAGFCDKHGISARERDIIEQVMAGRSNKDIEKALFISQNTVKNHLYNIYQKAGVRSRGQLVNRVLRFGREF